MITDYVLQIICELVTNSTHNFVGKFDCNLNISLEMDTT